MRAEKHTPAVQAKFRNRDTVLRDGIGPRKVDVSRLEANLQQARLAGSGPLLREARASVAIDKGPVRTCSGPATPPKPVAKPAKSPELVGANTIEMRPAQAPKPARYPVLDSPPANSKQRSYRFANLEQQLIDMAIGKSLVWTDAPKKQDNAAGVIYRIAKRHGLKLSTYMDTQGRRIVLKRGVRS